MSTDRGSDDPFTVPPMLAFPPTKEGSILLYLNATGCFFKLTTFPDFHTFAGLKNPRELNQTNSLLKESDKC